MLTRFFINYLENKRKNKITTKMIYLLALKHICRFMLSARSSKRGISIRLLAFLSWRRFKYFLLFHIFHKNFIHVNVTINNASTMFVHLFYIEIINSSNNVLLDQIIHQLLFNTVLIHLLLYSARSRMH